MSYIGQAPTNIAFVTDTFNGTGTTTAFTMSVAPASTSSILVAVTGVLQDPSTYSVSGTTLTFSAAPPSGTANISVRYLGIPASGVTTTAYRTVTEFTATAGQTSFSVPSYTVGYIDVYRNGSRLNSADYTASTGTTVVLAAACNAGDSVTTESFYVSSVLNAIPATAGAVNSTYIATGAVGQTALAAGVAGNGPAFSAYAGSSTTVATGTWTKIGFDTEEFDTNNNFASSRFTPTVAGYYQINATVSWSGTSGAAESLISIYKNGAEYKRSFDTNNAIIQNSIACIVYLNGSTDYVEIYCIQSSGGNKGTSNSSPQTWVNGFLARAA